MRSIRTFRALSIGSALLFLAVACVVQGHDSAAQKLWWSGYGPVLPHDKFPGDCGLCHVGNDWQHVSDEFEFDHEGTTGFKLEGAHARATCLRCHNDRGPVAIFQARGCAGCHEDIHVGQLGADCLACHTQQTWQPFGQYQKHNQTRFPLIGVHASTACHRCHPGAEIGRFVPTDTECVTCHQSDLLRATNPPHIALGYVDRCDRCHLPRTWEQAEAN
jgi:hypothetical protein